MPSTLNIVSAKDRSEQDANRAADGVMRVATRAPHVSSSDADRVEPLPEAAIQSARGGGHALDGEARALMETRFDHDVSRVRIHADGHAADLAKSLRARAFTVGSAIFFAAGRYRPGTTAGRRRLAHELTHTIQQETNAGPAVIQRQDEDQPEAPPQETAGDKTRKAILAAAEAWLAGEDFISAQKIDDIRKGNVRIKISSFLGVPIELAVPLKKPMKNYTTCIEFAGQSFRDGIKALHAGDQKRIVALTKDIEPLEAAKEEGPLDPKQKQELTRKKAQRKQLDTYIKAMKREIAKIDKKIKKAEEALIDLDKRDDAWVRTKNGMPATRPRNGEFVLFGQPPGQKTYGISTQTKVTLLAGSVKHIGILRTPVTVEGEWEVWNTIDGGGQHANEHCYFVRPADLLVWDRADKKPPPKDARPLYMLIGWVDSDKLLEMKEGPATKP